MIAILSLLLVVTLSILVTRVAAIALRHTGLARQTARFQARSAFSGAGFTTTESEKVVNHPVRRRIVLTLMLLGNAGIVTAVSSLMLAFASSQWVDRALERFTRLDVSDYEGLLHLAGDYKIVEFGVADGDWLGTPGDDTELQVVEAVAEATGL